MAEVETSRPNADLTGSEATQESSNGSADPAGTQSQDDTSTDKNWQKALQDKVELIKQKESEADGLRAKLKAIEDERKRQQLEEMSEADRYKSIADEEIQKRGKLEMKLLVQRALEGKNIPSAIRDLISETPWVIPPVKKELGGDFTWDQAIESVGRHLPDYVNSLVVDSNTSKDPEIIVEKEKIIDSERSTGNAIGGGVHIYTLDEIKKLSENPAEYEKHRDKILSQLSKGQLQ